MKRLALNIIGFQIAWWACVLSARAGISWVGIVVTATVFGFHLIVSPARSMEAWFIPVAACLGYVADTLATLSGALEFSAHPVRILPAPLWIAALWVAFATTLNTSFSWMQRRLVLAAVIGAASGPLAYAAGAALGVVGLPQPLFSSVVLALLWGSIVPLQVLISLWGLRVHDATRALPQGTGGTA